MVTEAQRVLLRTQIYLRRKDENARLPGVQRMVKASGRNLRIFGLESVNCYSSGVMESAAF
jgi:hypothetical protein